MAESSLLADIGSMLSGVGTIFAIFVAYKVHSTQKQLTQRQLLLPLWEYMSNISEIKPNAPIALDIIKAVNTLELVALCCEGNMVDEDIIKRTFKDQFIKHFENIRDCQKIPSYHLNGREILKENRAATAFYNKLEQDRIEHDRIKRL